MANFLFIFRNDPTVLRKRTSEEMQNNHENWDRWLKEGNERGWLVDMGDGLKPEGRLVNAHRIVTDGPFAESKEVVGGILILEARDLDHAVELMSKHPGVKTGPFEIRPAADMTAVIRESERRRSRPRA